MSNRCHLSYISQEKSAVFGRMTTKFQLLGFYKYVIEILKGIEKDEKDIRCYWMNSTEKRKYKNMKEDTLGLTLENSLWKRLWTCCKTLRN